MTTTNKKYTDRFASSSFPEDNETQKAYVEKMFHAMKNTEEDIMDKVTKSGAPAQAVTRFKNGYYDDVSIKMKCWELFVSLPFYLARSTPLLTDVSSSRLVMPIWV